mmetsp:Transcript_14329/g.42786  ORF Transcript_14329/g.42786 Transcript_14329/m.42786 type:complete len:83 (-) Transcript_14329:25-273(-)
MSTFAARILAKCAELGPTKSILAGNGVMLGGAFFCHVTYRAMYADGLPGTFTSNLWGEATEAYLKFQGADPISHPEVGRFKQ